MTLFQISLSKISARAGSLVAAAAVSSVLLFAAPQAHAGNAPYYKIELSQPAAKTKDIVRGVSVKCEGTACRAPMASSAPKNVCVSIAREFGAVASFTAGNRAFDATEIAACNGNNNAAVAAK